MNARQWLEGLKKWDGTQRINKLATEAFGIRAHHEAERCSAHLQMFFVNAVRRAFEPGCKTDGMLVLCGPQGTRKSRFLESLCAELFGWWGGGKYDPNPSVPKWIIDVGCVLEASTLTDLNSVYSKFVVPVGTTTTLPDRKKPTWIARDWVYVVSSNHWPRMRVSDQRIFWMIEVLTPIRTEIVTKWRDQLWAEAVAIYRAEASKTPWWMHKSFA